jgi:hypothetical protein
MSKGINSPAPTTAELVGGVYNSVPPTLAEGQAASLQLDVNGKLITSNSSSGTSNVNLTGINGTAPGLTNPLPVELSDGTNPLGTVSNPVRVDPTGSTTQPVSGTVTANAGTNLNTSALALDATLTGGTQKTKIVDTGGTNVASVSAAGAVKVDGSAATQPVSGTVTANAGTNLNTSALALDATLTGGTQKTKIVDTGGTNVASVSAAGAVKVDGSAATQPVNVAQVNGSTVSTATTGVQLVGIEGRAGTSLETTAGVLDENIKNVGNSAVATAASGVQKVGVVGNAGAIFDGATAATVPANALLDGARAATAYPTAVTDGQLVGAMADKAGRQAVVLNSVRDLIGTAILNSNSSTTVSFITAGASGVFNDIISLIITNESATATIATLTDNGSGGNTYKFALAGNGGIVVNFPTPLPQGTSAAAWQVLNSAGVALDWIAVYAKNK